MKPRLPSLPIPEFSRINYDEGLIAERQRLLEKARQIAMDNSNKASDSYKQSHDAKATYTDLSKVISYILIIR
jgi:hypothetical protein